MEHICHDVWTCGNKLERVYSGIRIVVTIGMNALNRMERIEGIESHEMNEMDGTNHTIMKLSIETKTTSAYPNAFIPSEQMLQWVTRADQLNDKVLA